MVLCLQIKNLDDKWVLDNEIICIAWKLTVVCCLLALIGIQNMVDAVLTPGTFITSDFCLMKYPNPPLTIPHLPNSTCSEFHLLLKTAFFHSAWVGNLERRFINFDRGLQPQ